jgi:Flp pilus assembly protein TadG
MTAKHSDRAPSTGTHPPLRSRPARRSERGQTLVEFAIASTLFMMTILGTMIFGIVVFRYNMLSDLAQEGARRASVCGFASGLRASGQCDVDAFVRSRALGIPLNSVTITPNDLTTLKAGQAVSVEVSHIFAPMTGILPRRTLTFSAKATMIASY